MSDLAAITCFFSYAKNPYAIKRYKEFQENLNRQGVKLYTVELAFFDNEFLLNDGPGSVKMKATEKAHEEGRYEEAERIYTDAFAARSPIYLKFRTDTVLWHKETLLNLLVKRLPPHIKKIAWLDSDIFIQDDDWAQKISKLLDKDKLVQIGSNFHFLKEDGEKERSSMKSIAYAYKNLPDRSCDFKFNHVGLGWAANRDFFNEVGLFDYDITGAGDTITYYSAGGLMKEKGTEWIRHVYKKKCPTILDHLGKYTKKCYAHVKGKINYLDVEVNHRYHGHTKRRGYFSRMDLLKDINFNEDIRRDRSGLLEWRDKGRNKPFEVFFSMKDDHADKKCDYFGIDKHYHDVT
jgi:hypothetical protein